MSVGRSQVKWLVGTMGRTEGFDQGMTRADLGLSFAVDVQEAGVGTGRLVQCFAVGEAWRRWCLDEGGGRGSGER